MIYFARSHINAQLIVHEKFESLYVVHYSSNFPPRECHIFDGILAMLSLHPSQILHSENKY